MIELKPTATKKKTYLKPKLTEVRLIPNEAVLNVCKEGIALEQSCAAYCGATASS
jgi:hypothetical protein